MLNNNVLKKEIFVDIENRIGEKRFNHSKRVANTAVELSKIHGADLDKVKLAAILHDCAKINNNKLLIELSKEYNLEITLEMEKTPEIIHGFLGAKIASEKYGIMDEDILNAIKYHTTGKTDMTKLEKIIYLADYIEPMRNFSGVEDARELAKVDLNKAMLFSLNNTIKFLCRENKYIALDTIKARNYLLEL